MKKLFFIFFVLLLSIHFAVAQSDKQVKVYPVGFYNLENLYHPMSTDSLRDKEFSPKGSYAWTMDKYNKKLENMAFTLNEVAKDFGGLVAVGVSEIGNKTVLDDLVATEPLKNRNWSVIHYQSPDWRGVDVGLLYDASRFNYLSSTTYPFPYDEGLNKKVTDSSFRTRDVLLVHGLVAGERVSIMVNHWPSRRGDKSVISRELAASVVKHIYDSLMKADPSIHVIIVGDMNDDPVDPSCAVVLNAKEDQKDVQPGGLFNTMWEKFTKGIGSLCYQGRWNMFDQIIISQNLLGSDYSSLKFYKAEVFNRDYLIQKTGRYKGYPFRTFSGGHFQNGFSDHFPT
ncbi:MAG: endonuclease/exonuclease/phosphatase family protein, partial [Bacteroidales bacterium]|nr:endonuclease/exonuclease/phosphatase family protein [Bacteroidales bacterium]